jgi:hypothetical protein
MRRQRPPHVVLAAWIATGPVGHLYAGVADWIVLLARYARARARARARGRQRMSAGAAARKRSRRRRRRS